MRAFLVIGILGFLGSMFYCFRFQDKKASIDGYCDSGYAKLREVLLRKTVLVKVVNPSRLKAPQTDVMKSVEAVIPDKWIQSLVNLLSDSMNRLSGKSLNIQHWNKNKPFHSGINADIAVIINIAIEEKKVFLVFHWMRLSGGVLFPFEVKGNKLEPTLIEVEGTTVSSLRLVKFEELFAQGKFRNFSHAVLGTKPRY